MEVSRESLSASKALKNMIDDVEDGGDIPVPMVDLNTLSKVFEYLDHHAEHGYQEVTEEDEWRTDNMTDWDKEYIDNIEKESMMFLFEIIKAANFLEIKPLLDLGCKKISNMCRGKSPEQITETFRIPEKAETVLAKN